MIQALQAPHLRDFGCGRLATVASAGSALLLRYKREPSYPHHDVEHIYPSHALVFTDLGEWQYHGYDPATTIGEKAIVAGTARTQYRCSHPRAMPNECFIVSISDEAFDRDERVFHKTVLPLTPEMVWHRRALVRSIEDAERLEGLAFSLYDLAVRVAADERAPRRLDVRIAYAKRLIRERAAYPVTVAAIARDLHLSRFTFTRRFLAQTGTTPHAYMTGVRIERAKALLRTTRLPIEEVALANGFRSIANFSNAFRRTVGVSPSAFRRLSV